MSIPVGLSFVPFFNVYWILPVSRGFAMDFNALVARRSLGIEPLPVTLFTALPVVLLASLVA